MTGGPALIDEADQAIVRSFDFALSGAGYERSGLTWAWASESSFVAFTAIGAVERDSLAYSMRFGWRYDAFGDPPPDPATAHGCVRAMTLDQLGTLAGKPVGALGRPSESSLVAFEQRLATVVRKHVLGWMEIWKRPEGFRDFLADRKYHLAAGWASALLGHDERARLELAYAAHIYMQPLDDSFDRMRADADGSFASVFAATNGLAEVLEDAGSAIISAFTSTRGATARDKVTEPHAEHRRMQLRHDAFARACARRLSH